MSWILVFMFAALCLVFTLLMPWAELGLPAHGPLEPVHQFITGFFGDLKDRPNFEYYVYSFFLALALISAAIAINVIGREESEEKTVLPIKK